MSDNEFDEFENDNSPGGLRKALKAQKKANSELEARLAALEAGRHGTGVRDALSSRGLNPAVAKFYPKDRPTTDDSVDEWVEENRAVFGFKAQAAPDAVPSDIPTNVQAGYGVLKQLQAAEAYTEMDFQSKLDACESPEAVLALLKDYSPPMQ
jgi:hypothetical protein